RIPPVPLVEQLWLQIRTKFVRFRNQSSAAAGRERARTVTQVERTRVDKWLWAVRAYPTRTAATDGCNGGHVRVNAVAAKPATMVQVGDRITVKGHGHERVFEVVRIIDKRVGAPVAVECYVDHSPPPPERDPNPPMFTRDRATGRPTKKDRRQMDRFRRG
ncbi:MAG: RNA-binding S4 domain-containing protein, partial [Ilumatobacteraceae bacterium]